MLAPNPLTTAPVWPVTGDVPDLQAIVRDQARVMTDKAALIDAYQGVLNAAQANAPITASGIGTATGTQLVMTGVTGTILIGATVTGTGVPAAPPATTIVNQVSGATGGSGTYTTSQPTTASAAGLSFTFTPPGINPSWPVPADAPTLMSIVVDQTACLRMQTSLLQQYQQLLNDSETAAPPTGP